jgi:hypothetical protein
MPTLTVRTNRIDSVTFVAAVLETEQPRLIRLETRFDGVVWPPRIDGTIADGWDEGGLTLEADRGPTAIGFATPVLTSERPIKIVRSESRGISPVGIERWIQRIEARVEAAESLAAIEDVRTATEEVADAGGLAEVETLAGEIARDQRIAAELSTVPDGLCDRLEAVEIPTTALATIAGESGS